MTILSLSLSFSLSLSLTHMRWKRWSILSSVYIIVPSLDTRRQKPRSPFEIHNHHSNLAVTADHQVPQFRVLM